MFSIFKKLSFRTKLFMLAFSLLAVAIGIGIFGQWTVGKINGVVVRMQDKQTIVDSMAGQASAAMDLAEFIWTEVNKNGSKSRMAPEAIAAINKKREDIAKGLASAETMPALIGKDKDDVKDIHNKWGDLQSLFAKLNDQGRASSGKAAFADVAESLTTKVEELAQRMGSVRTSVFDSTLENIAEAAEAEARNKKILYTSMPVFAVFALVAFFFRATSQPPSIASDRSSRARLKRSRAPPSRSP
jgi:hypothetical protein